MLGSPGPAGWKSFEKAFAGIARDLMFFLVFIFLERFSIVFKISRAF